MIERSVSMCPVERVLSLSTSRLILIFMTGSRKFQSAIGARTGAYYGQMGNTTAFTWQCRAALIEERNCGCSKRGIECA
jgi:hypothetical protein